MRTRVVLFFVCVCFLLLGGEHYLYAGTHNKLINDLSSHNFIRDQQVKLTNTDHSSTIIEDADLDLDEEYYSGHDVKDGGANKFFAGKYSLPGKWYLSFSHLFILNYYYDRFKIFPRFCGHSSPIYITQRVLRI